MKKLALLLIICLLNRSIFAQDATILTKGTPAPEDGLFFNLEAGKKIKHRLVEADIYQEMVKSLQVQVDLHEKVDKNNDLKYNILIEQNDKLAKSLHNQQSFNNLERIIWFSGGILATILVVYGVQRAIK